MSYCLVCLASGTKDPCVRCGHRTSKRVEQLVHLRLKSIYKAFKQSGAALSGKGGNNNNNNNNHNNSNNGSNNNSSHNNNNNNNNNHHSNSGEGRRNESSEGGEHNRGRRGDTHSSDPNNRNMPTWMAKKASSGSSVSMPLPASVQRYAEMHGKDLKKRPGNVNGRQNSLKGDVGAVLQVAAAAAASASAAAASSSEGNSKHRKGNKDYFSDCSNKFTDSDFDGVNRNHSKTKSADDSERFASRTQAEADAAAAALLAELDDEKKQTEASSKAKKSKKKKKKERQAAKEKEKEMEELRLRVKEEEREDELRLKEQKKSKKIAPPGKDVPITIASIDDCGADSQAKKRVNAKKKKKKDQVVVNNKAASPKTEKISKQTDDSNDIDSEDEDIARFTDVKNNNKNNNNKGGDKEDIEKHLADMVSANDLDGIEKLLTELKGVPGRAALRKNAKKAVKRIKEEREAHAAKLEQEQAVNRLSHDISYQTETGNNSNTSEGHIPYRAPEPLLKVVSKNNRIATPGQTARYECVMHMAPSVVGWVIGKGGQRIRDLMEESGAKVWIDQDSMGPKDMRVVYVSGNKKSIDVAVTMVKDLVAKAPVGGTTHGNTVSNQSINDASSVTSTRSSLTSTPVSLVQNFTQQAPPMAEKPNFSPVRKPSVSNNHQSSVPRSPNPNSYNAIPTTRPAPNSPSKQAALSMPPPGILGMSEVAVHNPPSPEISKVNGQQQKTPATAVHELTCEARFVPLLIGRRGWTVKQIQDSSGARVDIDQTVTPRRIIISGEVDQVHRAVRLVRGVLSYPHAKQQYSTNGELDESDADEAILRASTSVNEEFFAGISSAATTHGNTPYPPMQMPNEERQSMNHTDSNLCHPATVQNVTNEYNHVPMNQPTPDPVMLHQHQQFNTGLGLDMFSRTSGSGPVAPQMQVSPPPSYMNNSTTQSSAQPDPRLFMQRQHSAPLPAHQNLISSPEARDYTHHSIPSDTFQYDSILPPSIGITQNMTSRSPFAGMENKNTMSEANLGHSLPSYGFMEGSSGTANGNHHVSNERDAVNSMFGTKIDDSLLNSFNDFSFGGQESGGNLGSNFFDFLSNDGTEERSFGLGGVRLDVSPDNNANKEVKTSRRHLDQTNWGHQ
jgi:hypothetical protein